MDFSNEALQAAEKGFTKLMNAMETLNQISASGNSTYDVNSLQEKCYTAMNDDFNTPILIAHLFDGVKMINSVNDGKTTISLSDLETLQKHYNTFVFEILGLVPQNADSSNDELPSELMNIIIELRKKSKENKIFNLIKVFFYFFIKGIKFHKNFFLLFRVRKNQFVGHNFLPDWPGLYSNESFYKNLLIWLKNFIYIFILNRRLAIIVLKKI